MFSFKKVLILGLALSLVAVVFSSCSKSSEGGGGDSSSRENTLIFSQSADPAKLDPALVTDNFSTNVVASIYEGLFTTDPETLQIVPLLAESYVVSDDGLKYTIVLKKGIKFHDGTPFDSEAVKMNIKRVLKGSPTRTPEMEGYADIVFKNVRDVVTEGSDKVEILLTVPDSSLISGLSMDLGVTMVSPSVLKQTNDATSSPCGTGPWKFESWDRGSSIVLNRNENYHGNKALFKTLIYKIIPDPSSALAALLNGEIDFTGDISDVSKQKVEEAGCKAKMFPSLLTSYVLFNKSLSDEVTEAICHSIDVPTLTASLYKGNSDYASSFLPKEIGGHDPSVKYPKYDPALAKKLFQESGKKELTIECYSNVKPYNPIGGKALATGISGEIAKAGMECKVNASDWPIYMKKLAGGQFEVGVLGWRGDNVDPTNFLQLFVSTSALNYSKFNSPEYDELYGKSLTMPFGSQERKDSFLRLENILADKHRILPLCHNKGMYCYRSEIKNVNVPAIGVVNFSSISR
ncbi:MAG: ABC transporter substrate-binding protein [Oscillospiraceae bacterium]|jgi:peptide/nickel transport system substrate-binding protein|nr:ABC transporter substrate-binding protein [Oscillospiraceae bacterium]